MPSIALVRHGFRELGRWEVAFAMHAARAGILGAFQGKDI